MFCTLLLFFFAISPDIWEGHNYSKHSSVQKSHAETLLEHLPLKGDEKILDIGCGSGEITEKLAALVPEGEVIGLDPSISMLATARAHATQPNLSFLEGYAEHFSLQTKFDYAIAIHSLHWIKDQEKALANIALHLTNNGRAFFILAPSKEGLPFSTALRKTVAQYPLEFEGFVSNQQSYDLETYRKYMIQAGFYIDEIRYTRYSREFSSTEALGHWICQWLPHYKTLPSAKQSQFTAQLLENYLIEIGHSPDYSGPLLWEEYVLFVEATKKN